ncbi:MAG: hypothetical protein ACI8W7_003307, partial [Gammaproteobacteria bacterium]
MSKAHDIERATLRINRVGITVRRTRCNPCSR